MNPRVLADRVLESRAIGFAKDVLDIYGGVAGGLLANGLAYTALFASLPTVLLVLGFAGYIAQGPELQQELAARLSATFPPLAELVDDALAALSTGAGISSIVGLVGLVWGVSQFYATLDTAFARIFSAVPERDLAGRTIRGFIWVLVLVGVVVAAVAVGSLSTLIASVLPGQFPSARTVANIIGSPFVMLGVAILVVSVAFRVLPVRTPSWQSILPFATVVGIAVALVTQGFGLAVPLLVRAAAVVGSLAAAFIALAWLSFVFQILLIGATCVRVAEDRRRSRETAVH
jgi:YihY family inner membrane protein